MLESNIQLTESFIGELGKEWKTDDQYGLRESSIVWRGIPFRTVRSFIENFKFNERLTVFNDTKPLMDWIAKMTEEGKLGSWNIIVSGKKENTNGEWNLPNGSKVNKVKRTRKRTEKDFDETVFNIGVLRDPRDLLADVDIESISNDEVRSEIIDYVKQSSNKQAMAYRDKSGLETTPQMIIYRVDKNSKASGGEKSARVDLNAPCDLVGICLYIPGGRIGVSYASTISIKMKNDLFDGDADMEGTDAD